MIRHSHRGAVLVIVLLATLALAPAASATYPDRNGLIAFQADIGENGPQVFTIRSERAPAPPDHPRRWHRRGAGLVAGWQPDRVHPQRMAAALWRCPATAMNSPISARRAPTRYRSVPPR